MYVRLFSLFVMFFNILVQHVAVHVHFYSRYYSRQIPRESREMLTLYFRLYTGGTLLHHYNLHLKFVEY